MGAIDSFISNMAKSEGFARTAQFEVVFGSGIGAQLENRLG